jgi:uncharacterized protein (TIGR00369 family)
MAKQTTAAASDGPMAGLDATAAANCRNILSGGMAQMLGFHVTALTPKRISAEMRLLPRHMNHNGRVNGGALMAFADLLGALGAAIHRPPGHRGGTLESKTNFFSAGTGESIVGICMPLLVGRSTSVWKTTLTDAVGRTVAMVTQTQRSLPARSEPAPE